MVNIEPCCANEQWKPIKNYPNYDVSTCGRVKNQSRQILKPYGNQGYVMVTLYKNKHKKTFLMHRLVALTFMPNTETKTDVNHIDHCPSNNHLINLEWSTRGENIKHSHTKVSRKRLRCHSVCEVIKTDTGDLKRIKTYKSTLDASQILNISVGCLMNRIKRQSCINNTLWVYEYTLDNLPDEIMEIPIQKHNKYVITKDGKVFEKTTKRPVFDYIRKSGYVIVRLDTVYYLVHVLVALTWIGPPPSPEHVVNHIDENKSNNHVSNLEYVTKQQNTAHSMGRSIVAKDQNGTIVQTYNSVTLCASELNVSRHQVYKCCDNLSMAINGLNLSFIDSPMPIVQVKA